MTVVEGKEGSFPLLRPIGASVPITVLLHRTGSEQIRSLMRNPVAMLKMVRRTMISRSNEKDETTVMTRSRCVFVSRSAVSGRTLFSAACAMARQARQLAPVSS